MTDSRHIPQEDLALYAMGSLAPEEMASVAAHLASCAECREELARVAGELSLVALSVEQHPVPEGSLDRLLSQIRSERPAFATPVPVVAGRAQQEATNRRRWPVFIPWALAAALAIACIFLGFENKNLNDTVDDESALVSNLAAKASHAQAVLDVLNAHDAQRVTLTATKAVPAPTGHAIYLQDRGALLFQANNLKPVPSGKTYELWVIPANGKPPIPAGTFRPDAQGYASVVLPKLPTGVPAKMFGVTVENEGGAPSPTMPIVLAGQ